MTIRAFNVNTQERVTEIRGTCQVNCWPALALFNMTLSGGGPEAHTDYIRCLEVHPTQPYVLSSSDDLQIKLWDWEKVGADGAWTCTQVFEGHAHYVMMVKFNPKDTNTFASGSLDRTIKVWGLTANTPYFSLEGHQRGVNCIDYYTGVCVIVMSFTTAGG
jgi:WD40 repeat protein